MKPTSRLSLVLLLASLTHSFGEDIQPGLSNLFSAWQRVVPIVPLPRPGHTNAAWLEGRWQCIERALRAAPFDHCRYAFIDTIRFSEPYRYATEPANAPGPTCFGATCTFTRDSRGLPGGSKAVGIEFDARGFRFDIVDADHLRLLAPPVPRPDWFILEHQDNGDLLLLKRLPDAESDETDRLPAPSRTKTATAGDRHAEEALRLPAPDASATPAPPARLFPQVELTCFFGSRESTNWTTLVATNSKLSRRFTFGPSGKATEITWDFLGNLDGRDLYRFTRRFPADRVGATTVTNLVMFGGAPLTAFEDDQQVIVLATHPASPKPVPYLRDPLGDPRFTNITVTCKLRAYRLRGTEYAAGQVTTADAQTLEELRCKGEGFVMEIVEPAEFKGQTVGIHHDGPRQRDRERQVLAV